MANNSTANSSSSAFSGARQSSRVGKRLKTTPEVMVAVKEEGEGTGPSIAVAEVTSSTTITTGTTATYNNNNNNTTTTTQPESVPSLPLSSSSSAAALPPPPPPTSSSSSLQPIKHEVLTIGDIKHQWDAIEAASTKCSNKKKKDNERIELWCSVIQNGSIEMVKYFLDLLSPVTPDEEVTSSMPCEHPKDPDRETTSSTNSSNNFINDLGCRAAEYGRMELLQWACENNIGVSKNDERVCKYAFGNGHMDLFHWAVQYGFEWDMKYYDIVEEATFLACQNGHLDALKWLHANGGDLLQENYRGEYTSCCDSAAIGGHISVLEWLDSIGARSSSMTVNDAIGCGHLHMVKYLLDNFCDWDDESCAIAAFAGYLDILQLLRSVDCEWDDQVTAQAASAGHREIIEWAISNGCLLSESACQYAAGFGQFETLKWLRHTKNCLWDDQTTKYASTDEIYEWAKCNGCPIAKGNPRAKLRSYYDHLTVLPKEKQNPFKSL